MDEENLNRIEFDSIKRKNKIICFFFIFIKGISILIYVTVAVLFLVSFSSLEATEFGLDYSWYSKSVCNTNTDIKQRLTLL